MNTLHFAKHESAVRRIAAALAVVVTLGLVSGMGALADREYDDALMAYMADSQPTQVVVVTARRLHA